MEQPPWLDDLEMRAWRSLLAAHTRLLQRLDAELQATQSMSVSDYGVLVELSESVGDNMRMSELAERMLLSPSGLTRRLDSLVAAGLVDRVRCPTDRRGSFAVLTAAGRARLERAAPDHVDQVRRHFVQRLTRAQLTALADALDQVAAGPPCAGVTLP
ncbi:MAG: MarR family winged helix-turn-helix transcriptional regulator [Acidimicrobiales bacterium]